MTSVASFMKGEDGMPEEASTKIGTVDRRGHLHSEPRVDAVIRDARIIDGSGVAPRAVDILIQGGEISGLLAARTARVSAPLDIDAGGLTVTPGFIDAHVHSDADLLRNGQHAASLLQGVTTHIIGQDGLSYAPLGREGARMFAPFLPAVNGAAPFASSGLGVAEFRALFDGTVALNTAYAVPHGALHVEAGGFGGDALTGASLDKACALLERALDEGGVALSSGLSYFPGSFADTDELVALARVAARRGVPYVTHVRSAFTHGPVDPLGEAIDIARRSGAKLHVSHWRTTPATVGHVDQVLAQLDAAFDEGLDVSLDTYPYIHGSGPLYIGLPAWAFVGGPDATLERLADPAQRSRLIQGIEDNPAELSGILTHVPGHPDYEDRDLRDIARERGQSIPDLACDLLLDARLDITFHLGTRELLEDHESAEQFEKDCLEVLDRPYTMIGSDGIFVGKVPHERAFGTFAKLLRLARERRFDLPKLINRMTRNAADRFALAGRGRIEVGSAADLVGFHADSVREKADRTHPRRAPQGIEFVFVNGELAVDEGHVTGLFAGQALRPDGAVPTMSATGQPAVGEE